MLFDDLRLLLRVESNCLAPQTLGVGPGSTKARGSPLRGLAPGQNGAHLVVDDTVGWQAGILPPHQGSEVPARCISYTKSIPALNIA